MGAEFFAEELVEPADHEHGHAVFCILFELSPYGVQVFLNYGLSGVLAAASDNNIDVVGEGISGVVVENFNVEPMGVCAACQR